MDSTLVITSDDIAFAERLMGVTFNDEQRDVLCCVTSRDTVACPGSGKTTTLVAKLAILARKGVTGICVLSHTNVAKREIETKLGKWAGVLCSYPNYVGTIQGFVDRFLAIPAMVAKFKARPWAIDDDTFGRWVSGKYLKLPYGIRMNLENRNQSDGRAVVRKLRFSWEGKAKVYLDGDDISRFGKEHTDTFKSLRTLKYETMKDGCLAYRDAFGMASWYIEEYPQQQELFQRRFPYVFVDEMQDTDAMQSQLLDAIFAHSVVQRFGDPNQAIYHSVENSDSGSAWRPDEQTSLTITHSSRLSVSIAGLSKNVCSSPLDLKGNPTRASRPHTIFLFDSSSREMVLPAYAELLAGIGDFDLGSDRFTALGAIRRKPDKDENLALPSYWRDFNPVAAMTTSGKVCLADYLQAAWAVLRHSGSCGLARDELLTALVRITRIENLRHPLSGKPYTNISFVDSLCKQFPDEYSKLTQFLRDIVDTLRLGTIPDTLHLADTITHLLRPLNGPTSLSSRSVDFVTGSGTGIASGAPVSPSNVFRYDTKWGTVQIGVHTIHSVKGETHRATLVLETFFRTFDLKTLVPHLLGRPPKNPPASAARFLPLVFVAMTRPTELLCLAMHKDHLTAKQRAGLDAIGWRFVDL